MSKEVKRYDPFGYDGLSALMHEDAHGDWIRGEDYDALRLELAEANADFVRIANERDALLAERDRLAAENERLARDAKNDSIAYRAVIERQEELRAEVEALKKDAERLDRLDIECEAYGCEGIHEGNRWMIDGPFRTVRDAIDAAMQGEQP